MKAKEANAFLMVKLGKPKSTSMRINTVFESSFGLRDITVFSTVIGFLSHAIGRGKEGSLKSLLLEEKVSIRGLTNEVECCYNSLTRLWRELPLGGSLIHNYIDKTGGLNLLVQSFFFFFFHIFLEKVYFFSNHLKSFEDWIGVP